MARSQSAAAAARAVQALLDTGQTVAAYEAATRALVKAPRDRRLRRSLGLALARLHAHERANALLLDLFRADPSDAETAGILGRTFKDLWEAAAPGRRRHELLRKAFRYYALGFGMARRRDRLDDAIYTGINVATMAWLLGRRAAARAWAKDVQRLCQRRLKRGRDYWAMASLGEAALLLGRIDEAERCYERAARFAVGEVQRRASTRHNARLILASMRRPVDVLDHCFSIPDVLVVEDGLQPRSVPPAVVASGDRKGTIAYVQPHSRAGLETAERLLAARADVTAVLPLTPSALERAGHPLFAPPRMRARVTRVLRRATRVVIAHQRGWRLSPTTLRYATALQKGLAALHAQRLETTTTVVHVGGAERGLRARHARRVDRSFHEAIKALLFADVSGYSTLNEWQIPEFVSEFMGTVARCLARAERPPEIKYTWGDALYFVFPDVEGAALCALDIQDALTHKNWAHVGLPADLSLRVALHVGPALGCRDPVQRSRNYTGSHVSWAARIEPVTPPGQVYASEPFAALAAARDDARVTCEYVGATILAKGFGTYPLYRVRRRTGPDAPRRRSM